MMRPFFILSTPRSGGTALCRMLDTSPGVKCAGESLDLLPRLREMEEWPKTLKTPGLSWPRHAGGAGAWQVPVANLLRQWVGPDEETLHWGLRSSYFGRRDWRDAVESWSWLLERVPDARLIFLRRPDNAAAFTSVEMTIPMWIPGYGTCPGSVEKTVREHRLAMEAFHDMNPSRTALLEIGDVFDLERLNAKLEPLEMAVSLQAWMREAQQRHGDLRLIKEDIDQMVLDDVRQAEADGVEDPFFGAGADLARMAEAAQAELEKPGNEMKEVRPKAKDKVRRLPIPTDGFLTGKVEVHTIRFGAELWMDVCAKTLDEWAGRNGYELKVRGDDERYPCAKFQEIDMLREFLAGESDWLLYVDSDIYVHPATPPLPEVAGGFHARGDLNIANVSGTWVPWVEENFGETPPAWRYRNAGVWLCDRAAAAKVLAEAERQPITVGQQEQHQFNWWLVKSGAEVHELPHEWNRFSQENKPGWFYHLAGGDKLKKLGRIRERRLLPAEPETFTRWASTGPRAVAYPFTIRYAKGRELLTSIVSVRKYLKDCPPIHVFGDRKPDWLPEDVHWHHAPPYHEAIAGCVQIADEVLVMNDDIYLLEPRMWDDFCTALYRQTNLVKIVDQDIVCTSQWRRGVGRATASLIHHGHDVVHDFSTHTPYLFEREKAIETLRRHGCWWKMPMETLYHNDHGTPKIDARPFRTYALPAPPGAWYLNHGGDGPDHETARHLEWDILTDGGGGERPPEEKRFESTLLKHRSDRCRALGHSYSAKYEEIIGDRKGIEVLEIGAGRLDLMRSIAGDDYRPGAGARAFSEHFGARVTILENDEATVKAADGVECLHCDAYDAAAVARAIGGREYDLIIDDGSHAREDQLRVPEIYLNRLRPGGTLVIEDIPGDETAEDLVKRYGGSIYRGSLGRWDRMWWKTA